jgi:hypothetical protein
MNDINQVVDCLTGLSPKSWLVGALCRMFPIIFSEMNHQNQFKVVNAQGSRFPGPIFYSCGLVQCQEIFGVNRWV